MALPKGFVQNLYSYVSWIDFKQMRLVCKMWCEASYLNQSHWLKWLHECGEIDHWQRIGHRKETRTCDFRTGQCIDPNHYDTVVRHPRILKTVPIHKQALNQAVRFKKAKLQRRFQTLTQAKQNCEAQIVTLKMELTDVQNQLQISETLLEKHYQKRKRTHIEFSKQ